MLQFKEGARQVAAEDIADELQGQAADAEDAQIEEAGDTEAAAALKAQAAAQHSKAAGGADTKTAPVRTQHDKAGTNGGVITRELTQPVVGGEAARGVSNDVHEADVDLSHADSAPGESAACDSRVGFRFR